MGKVKLSDFIVGVGILLILCLLIVSVNGCQTWYSAKAYVTDNVASLANAGATCILDKPDEYTVSFGWTFKKDPVTGTYTEQSITYVTVGLICKDYYDNEMNLLPTPKISHTTVTCDVTKKPDEGPCWNLVEWGIIEKINKRNLNNKLPDKASSDIVSANSIDNKGVQFVYRN